MKCLILAAGYATRLYPLTENFPKPLLTVGNDTILGHLITDIEKSGEVDEYVVISNHKFAHIFKEWAARQPQKIVVVDDGTESNETRLGAVRDIQFAIDELGLDGDMLVIAGDNLLDFSLVRFIEYARRKQTSCIMRYYEPSEMRLTKCGVVSIDGNDRITEMEEKPAEPKSNWCCPPFYYYTAEDAKLVKKGIEQGCGIDAPGSYIAWLSSQVPVHAMEMPGKRYDIGNIESYEKVKKEYRGITTHKERQVIASREQCKEWLEYEFKKYGRKYTFLDIFELTEGSILRKHQYLLRKTELYINTKKKLLSKVFWIRLSRIQNKYALHVVVNGCGKGLKIMHVGPVLMNGKTKIGENCSIHINASFVAGGVNDDAPTVGNNVIVGVGAVIVGGVTISDNVAIGANAVVNKSVDEPNICVAGVPAKKISNNGSSSWNKNNLK